ncbi:hypothetical protein [Sinomicrobium sp. M5D2P9]
MQKKAVKELKSEIGKQGKRIKKNYNPGGFDTTACGCHSATSLCFDEPATCNL